ncbi:hypothetical protein GCT13_41300 [Paraburkholderia sp. CNPSo 3157]|uniref:Uncharacterized protein n=1 Tax=Paraburkholderia franconis TaxID=2654983 RepID=A0A7X1NJL2_9BURK|nr:hypothetical protein [Paraburkholderia franconis]
MKVYIVGRYRGFVMRARIEPRTIRLSGELVVRYRVTWSLRRTSQRDVIGDFAHPVMYASEGVAIASVDRRARAFIDAMLGDGAARTTSGP